MKYSVFICITWLIVSAQWKTIDGTRTVVDEYPQMVSIQFRGEHRCGGTLVSGDTVLTAAHCVYAFRNMDVNEMVRNKFRCIIGEYDLESISGYEKVFQIIKIIIYPEYTNELSYLDGYDVALIKFDGFLSQNEVSYIKYSEYQKDSYINPHARCETVGWGSLLPTGEGHSRYLQKADLNIVSNEECSVIFQEVLHNTYNICAGAGRLPISPCEGDSGGPLFCKNEYGQNIQVGIISYGMEPCGQPHVPTVYINLSEFANWIDGEK